MRSESDERVVNNVMRHEYRVLSDEEKLQITEIKDLGANFVAAVERIARASGRHPYQLVNARDRAEEAVFWAVKYITGEKP